MLQADQSEAGGDPFRFLKSTGLGPAPSSIPEVFIENVGQKNYL